MGSPNLVQGDGYRFRLQVRFLGGDGDGQGLPAGVAGDRGCAIGQHGTNEISDFFQIGVGESGEEVVGQHLVSAGSGHEDGWDFVQAAHHDCAFRAYDFGANVVAVNRLRVRFDIADGTFLVLQVHGAGDHVAVLGHLGTDRAGGEGMYVGDFIAHHPAGQIKIVNRVGVENHSVHVRFVGGDGRLIFISPDRFKNYGDADFSGFDSAHGCSVGRVVAPHETDLQPAA